MGNINFSDIGRVEAVRRMLETGGFPDNGSVSFLGGKNNIIRSSSRLWMEGIDFDLTYFPLKHLGYKCLVGTIGELYASMYSPETISIRIGVSSKLDYDQVSELWLGICTAAREHNIKKADLDLCPSYNGLIISISVTGIISEELEASKKKISSKDLICVSGNVGAAYLGMRLLDKEKERLVKAGDLGGKLDIEHFKMIASTYLKPEISPFLIKQMKENGLIPSFGCLVCRGLADAAKKIQKESGLGVKLYSDKIPFEGNSFELGRIINVDPVSAAMNGGDDFRLLFVVPQTMYETLRHDFQTFSIIGHVAQPEVGTVIVMPEGAELPLHAQGWREEDDDAR